MDRRKFITKSGLIASASFIPDSLMLFARWNEKDDKEFFDVIIVGGSYSGLSAALALGRSLRKVLIIDNGEPCNRFAPRSHNFITQDGEVPSSISEKGRKQILKYETVFYHQDTALEAKKSNDIFVLKTKKGKEITAKKILFATGLKDLIPGIKGYSECWGISVLHCPYCHGYELRGEETGILGNGNLAFHYAQLISNLTQKLTVFTNGKSDFSAEQNELLKRNNVKVVEEKITALEHQNGNLKCLHLANQTAFPLVALYARPGFEQNCKIPMTLGCDTNEQGLLVLDNSQQTNISGVYACGDNSAFRSIAIAVSTGSIAGAAISAALSIEKFNFLK
ncbi:pyridine nucleotide-disulfide oxidoreductase [Sphingobacterium sp. Ag1]|uniref:NAD(P)/FAD-dependent oxidoreductase n=1 Tax=Sphingobacterium sp. Ag1 TaxID=1643451 RepID=UPI00062787CB|nr:NAD(P)/FAD-dependent oxidoreductase [Sphingobacterium sp. Ag1]KKO92439.1 pyridine nucleotide-disulfide oxidoreductase [Sphingobacterium sp. Ag1]